MKIKCVKLIGDMNGCVTIGKVYEVMNANRLGSDTGYRIINDRGSGWWVNRDAFIEINDNTLEVTW